MSNYTQQQETEIVRDAMTLTTAIKIDKEELSKLKSERFDDLPSAPTRRVLKAPQIVAEIPAPPKSQYSYSDFLSDCRKKLTEWIKSKLKLVILIGVAVIALIVVIAIVSNSGSDDTVSGGFGALNAVFAFFSILSLVIPLIVVLLIVSYFKYKQKCKELDQQLSVSKEYLEKVEKAKTAAEEQQKKAEAESSKQQAQIDAKYKSDLEHYNTVVVPNYKKELAEWKDIQSKKIAMIEEDLSINTETLENLYDTTRLVSVTYRELWILRWLYDDMRSSDHDVRYATELLDRDRQRLATEQSARIVRDAVNDMHSTMMSGFEAVYDAIEDGNEELAKMRRDQNLANAAGIAQRHNLNKLSKHQNEVLDKHFNKK